MAALRTATPLANSRRATLRSACNRARCSLPPCASSLFHTLIARSLGRVADIATKLFDDFLGCAFGGLVFAHIERNGPNARVPAATISLAYLGEIDSRWRGGPGVRSY